MLRDLALCALLTAGVLACSTKDEPAAKAALPSPATSAGALRFRVGHIPAKASDPVVVEVPGVTVVSAAFTDPADLTGGSATLAIDLGTLASGKAGRDRELKADYFEIGQFPRATVVIKDVVKAASAGHYRATAAVDLHGVQRDVAVEFEVVEVLADGGVRVTGTARLSRLDFKVGRPSGADNSTGEEVAVELDLTVRK